MERSEGGRDRAGRGPIAVRGGWAQLARDQESPTHRDADLILVCVPAYGLGRIGGSVRAPLRDGQTVIHIPGGLSSYTFWKAIRRVGYSPDLLLADVATLPYGSRITGPTQVTVYVDAVCLPIAALPASRTTEAVAALQQLYPVAAPRADILDVALLNVNPIVHPGLSTPVEPEPQSPVEFWPLQFLPSPSRSSLCLPFNDSSLLS